MSNPSTDHGAPSPTPAADARRARPALILASTSRYRRELLARLGLPFEVLAPQVDEARLPGESPSAMARRLAIAKARAVSGAHPDAVVIGSDQTATLDDVDVIGKPGNHANAVAQLRRASGRTLVFHTAMAVVRASSGFERSVVVHTRVRFRDLTDAQIEAYLAREPAYDCAGSAKAEGLGIALMASLEGSDPSALVGLPLIELTTLLDAAGCPVL